MSGNTKREQFTKLLMVMFDRNFGTGGRMIYSLIAAFESILKFLRILSHIMQKADRQTQIRATY